MDTQLKDNMLIKTPIGFASNKLINPDIIVDDEEIDDEDDTLDELDDETLEIINQIRSKRINLEASTIFLENKPVIKKNNEIIKKSQKKEKNKLTLQEFSKNIESESKPTIKKFTSKRVEHKKNQFIDLSDTLIPKRQFNPRKPIYFFKRKVSTTNIPEYNNIQEFPQLK
jgi:hypothetical protein